MESRIGWRKELHRKRTRKGKIIEQVDVSVHAVKKRKKKNACEGCGLGELTKEGIEGAVIKVGIPENGTLIALGFFPGEHAEKPFLQFKMPLEEVEQLIGDMSCAVLSVKTGTIHKSVTLRFLDSDGVPIEN